MAEQTFTQKIKRPKLYDGKELWEKYHSWGKAGTVRLLNKHALERGMYDSDVGKPSQMGPYIAMWRYAYYHPDEAYPVWLKWTGEYRSKILEQGIDVSIKAFLDEIEHKAKSLKIRKPEVIAEWRRHWNEELKEKA